MFPLELAGLRGPSDTPDAGGSCVRSST